MSEKTFQQAITEILIGETQKNALDFAAFLNANDMGTGDDGSNGTVTYNGEVLAYMHMDGKPEMPGPWTIWPSVTGTVPEDFVFDEAMKEIAWKNVNICGKCGGDCAPGSRKTVYGKEFDNVCGAILAFTDPTADELACVKRVLEMIKYDVTGA